MQVQPATLDILAVLKAQTHQQHKQIEQRMPFFNATFTLQEYVRTVAIFLGFWEPMEQRLAAINGWQTVGIHLTHRFRAHRLHRDLRALGVSELEIENFPRATSLPILTNVYNGLGCLYVLEGSTLGGQLIARELARRFAIDDHSGTSFFFSHGSNVGEQWQQFCSAVTIHVDHPAKENAALTSAVATFASLDSWFQKRTHYAK
jgi:heme oxygenase (biliverdin-IX-beta and delta-forming)